MITSNGIKIKFLQHMTSKNNLRSLLENGILSHNEAYANDLIMDDISMSEVQERRKNRKISIKGKILTIHDFVSFYFNAKNPMLYKRKNIQHELFILLINADIINTQFTDNPFAIFSDGNE
jgi:predicted DNA-binding protein YlxM (UPF0122 family)